MGLILVAPKVLRCSCAGGEGEGERRGESGEGERCVWANTVFIGLRAGLGGETAGMSYFAPTTGGKGDVGWWGEGGK